MERLKKIINFPDYRISSMGKIERITTKSGIRCGKNLKQNLKKCEYLYICLIRNNKRYYKRVHIKMFFKLGFRNKYHISIPTVSQIRINKLWFYINV